MPLLTRVDLGMPDVPLAERTAFMRITGNLTAIADEPAASGPGWFDEVAAERRLDVQVDRARWHRDSPWWVSDQQLSQFLEALRRKRWSE